MGYTRKKEVLLPKIKSVTSKRGVLKVMKSLLGQPLMGCKLYIFYG